MCGVQSSLRDLYSDLIDFWTLRCQVFTILLYTYTEIILRKTKIEIHGHYLFYLNNYVPTYDKCVLT